MTDLLLCRVSPPTSLSKTVDFLLDFPRTADRFPDHELQSDGPVSLRFQDHSEQLRAGVSAYSPDTYGRTGDPTANGVFVLGYQTGSNPDGAASFRFYPNIDEFREQYQPGVQTVRISRHSLAEALDSKKR